ncbi:unnamed protein product [Lymnaea stagnalis]|uniref:CABIT domain-containing protein n=1 Tax=Lymnaea stagnalis TaxID=6523 RepID=A0AAV2HZ83_LYMST
MMLGHNYEFVGGQRTKSEVASTSASGIDLYKSSFTEPGETEYVWSESAKSLSDILKDATLPVVVKLCSDGMVKDHETPIDLQRPLLLYKEFKGKKLHARNIRAKSATIDTTRIVHDKVGPYVTFPDTFTGYFREIDTKDHPLLSIGDVTRIMPKLFISAGDYEGYLCVSQFGENLYQKSVVPTGLYKPTNVLQDTITYINKRKSEKKKLVRCLSCEDDRGKIALFPLETKGIFYIGALGSSFPKTNVSVSPACMAHRWTEFEVQRMKSLRVRMVHGKPPLEECSFTGLLEFSHVTEEHTVIVSTLSPAPRLFEMAVTSEPFFLVALNSNEVPVGALQQKCLKFAKNETEAYMATVKVKRDYGIEQADSTNDQE